MKKIICLLFVLSLCLLCGCNNDTIGIIGGSDGPTSIFVSEKKEGYEISPVKIINIDGTLYYNSGLLSKVTGRCGTLDGNLTKGAEEYEIPKKDKETNFEIGKEHFGYQNVTSITKEIPTENGWEIYKKVEDYGVDLLKYKYAYIIKGRHPNAVKDSKYLIFANTKDITFETITKYFFSSQLKDHQVDIAVRHIEIYDEWGINMWAEDVTPNGIVLHLEQFGGNFKGELNTGPQYTLEIFENDKWTEVKTKYDSPLAWNQVAYNILKNERTKFNIDFSLVYNPLKKGRYRVGKEIMDFIETGKFNTKTYYAEFSIE